MPNMTACLKSRVFVMCPITFYSFAQFYFFGFFLLPFFFPFSFFPPIKLNAPLLSLFMSTSVGGYCVIFFSASKI